MKSLIPQLIVALDFDYYLKGFFSSIYCIIPNIVWEYQFFWNQLRLFLEVQKDLSCEFKKADTRWLGVKCCILPARYILHHCNNKYIRYLPNLTSLLTSGRAKINNKLLARSQFHFVGRDKKNCIAKASIAYRPGAIQSCFPVPLSEVKCSKVSIKTSTTSWQNKVDSIDLTFLLVLLGEKRRGKRLGKNEQQQQCRGNQQFVTCEL